MEFNTQICTTREQSERLRAMGLNPETADMYITNMSIKGFSYTDQWQIGSVSYKDVMSFWAEKGLKLENTYWEIIPAWSLHRLMEICHFENSYFTNLDNAYNAIIRDIEGKIRFNMLDSRYLIEKSNER